MTLLAATVLNAADKQLRGVFPARTTMTSPSIKQDKIKGSEVERIGEVSTIVGAPGNISGITLTRLFILSVANSSAETTDALPAGSIRSPGREVFWTYRTKSTPLFEPRYSERPGVELIPKYR